MTTDISDKLIINYFEGNSTQAENKLIDKWLEENDRNKKHFAFLKKNNIELKLDTESNHSETETAHQKLVERIELSEVNASEEEDNTIIFRDYIFRYAAIILFLIAVGGGSYLIGKKSGNVSNNAYCEISAPLGGKSSVILPDGTKIWLNAGSKISYNAEFNKKSRDIFLEGEAFFDVAKKEKPFIVHTSDIDIHVFGTSFNVKSYPDEDRIETTLVEGSIRVDQKKSEKPIFLNPNEKLVYYKKINTAKIQGEPSDTLAPSYNVDSEIVYNNKDVEPIEISKNVNIDEEVSWKDGSLIFNQQTLEGLSKKLERKYDIIFKFEDDELKNYSYSGTLRDYPLEQVLKALKYTSPIDYTINEKVVVLKYNKKFHY